MEALCLEDLDSFGRELNDALEELAQDLFHRIIEAPGSNPDDPARGFGLEERLSGATRTSEPLTSLEHALEAELRKAEGVHDVRAAITMTAPGEYRGDVQIEADEGVLGITLVKDGSGVRRVA